MMHDFSLTEKYVVLYDLPVALDFGSTLRSRPAKAVATLLTRFVERHAAPDFFLRAAMRGSRARRRGPVRHALPLGARTSGSRRRDAARGHRGRHPMVRGERVLRVPPAQRLRRRRPHRARRRAAPVGVHRGPCDRARATRRWIGGPSTSPRARSPRSASTTRAGIPAGRRATGRSPVPLRVHGRILAAKRTGISTPDAILKHDLTTRHTQSRVFGAGREPGEFVFVPSSDGCCRGRRRGDGIRLRPVHRPQRPGAARRADPGNGRRRCTFRPGCRTAFTATGYRLLANIAA